MPAHVLVVDPTHALAKILHGVACIVGSPALTSDWNVYPYMSTYKYLFMHM